MNLLADHSQEIAAVVVQAGLLLQNELHLAHSTAHSQGMHLLDYLLREGVCTEEEIYRSIAQQLNLFFWSEYELSMLRLDPQLLDRFPLDFMMHYLFLPLRFDITQRTLHVVATNPYDEQSFQQIQQQGQAWEIVFGLTTPSVLVRAIQIHKRHLSSATLPPITPPPRTSPRQTPPSSSRRYPDSAPAAKAPAPPSAPLPSPNAAPSGRHRPLAKPQRKRRPYPDSTPVAQPRKSSEEIHHKETASNIPDFLDNLPPQEAITSEELLGDSGFFRYTSRGLEKVDNGLYPEDSTAGQHRPIPIIPPLKKKKS